MTACRDQALAVSLHAAGALEGAEAAALERHLSACAACRAEAARAAALLSAARLPPPGEAELRALDGLAESTSAALAARRPAARTLRALGTGRRLAVGLLAIAAVAALVIVPVAVRQRLPGRAAAPAEVAEAERWQEPDLDTLWQDTEVLSLEETASSDQESAALAAYDGG
ncbi:conserved hypothetical protein [Anaeromyxobacter sp. K]|uniref:zf-HC2 domain-containing protein n=1 Tax=Anaeromyxobacter sp. (strain K) TaxID=447217 RepID=UPI00015F94C6|nr:zf-HC2 domain-containing protein [Anaeromyxobacter sp. K]ACG75123.1 conserved hypothetical protein [Anaeromyxobacter sp. K]